MVANKIKLIISLFICLAPCLTNATSWTVLLHAESDAYLNPAIFKNIVDFTKNNRSDSVNCLVQLHSWANIGWRFIIRNGSLVPVAESPLTLDPATDLIDSARWAFSAYPADHYMVILSGNGEGVLDPVWDASVNDWRPEIAADWSDTCGLKKYVEPLCKNRRGILLNSALQSYLTNSEMVRAFATITLDVLDGQKIDIVGMDACRMAMVEIGCQLEPFVNAIIGSQDCELVDGWDFAALAQQFATDQIGPRAIAASIVQAYGTYYAKNASIGTYTQSAFDLTRINDFIDSLDSLVDQLIDLQNDSNISAAISQARAAQTAFCKMPSYIDCISFLQALKSEITSLDSFQYDPLLTTIDQAIELAQNMLIANIHGSRATIAQGFSVYFPSNYEQSSYANCLFAQQTRWCEFLETFFNAGQTSLI